MSTREEPAGMILLIEDNRGIAEMVGEFLERRGYAVDYAGDGVTGLHLAVSQSFDVIVLDLMLPGMDGLDLCRKLRQEAKKSTPVLMLTARDTLQDKLTGLDAGADDYLVKPFAFSELLARVHNLLRRRNVRSEDVLRYADLEIDSLRHKVWRAGEAISLAPQEYRLLAYLMRFPGEVLTRTRIAEQGWDLNFDGDSNVVDVAVRRLRRKIDDPYSDKLIHTLRGVGYVLETRR
jgi:two-component system copper resistance phosphate regulon response regulator CusR